ncbi:MAG: KGK domain-containing protein, partial [Spirulinaceae cyanobacterium]
MDNKFEPLSGGEVLSVDDSVQFLIGHTTFRAEELSQALRTQILEHGIGGLTEAKKHWLTENGINCEVLRFGANGWQKGKVRISLEFCPSEGEAEDLEESIGSEDESGLSAFEQEDDSDLEELALDADEPTIIEEEFA